jgi:glycosyltransferase involved in cell wall biosynthesis
VRAELRLPHDAPLVGTAAVLRSQKALHVLIEAHARVVGTIPAAHLVVAGRGECRQDLERRARELGTEASVHFLGRRRDVDALLGAFDVAAMSSDFEGTPLFVFECMAAGTPLVATAVGGVPDVIEDGRTGILVPPRDPGRLAEAIVGLLGNAEERRRLAAAAGERLGGFSIDATAARFASLYESLVGEAAAKSAGGV